MSNPNPPLDTAKFEELKTLFILLRLFGSLLFVFGGWQLVIGIGLIFSLTIGAINPLITGFGLIWLGWLLWQSSKVLEPLTVDISAQDLTNILLDFTLQIKRIFYWAGIFIIVNGVLILLAFLWSTYLIIT
jgi:hypothetical protein